MLVKLGENRQIFETTTQIVTEVENGFSWKGTYYWRTSHSSLNQDYGRQGSPISKFNLKSLGPNIESLVRRLNSPRSKLFAQPAIFHGCAKSFDIISLINNSNRSTCASETSNRVFLWFSWILNLYNFIQLSSEDKINVFDKIEMHQILRKLANAPPYCATYIRFSQCYASWWFQPHPEK